MGGCGKIGLAKVGIKKTGIGQAGAAKVGQHAITVGKIHILGHAVHQFVFFKAFAKKTGIADDRIGEIYIKRVAGLKPFNADGLAVVDGHFVERSMLDIEQRQVAAVEHTVVEPAIVKCGAVEIAACKLAVVKAAVLHQLLLVVTLLECFFNIAGYVAVFFHTGKFASES